MTHSSPVRVALLNDHQLVVEGLLAMLRPYADRVEVVDVSVGRPQDGTVDVVLFDTFGSDVARTHWSHFVADGWDSRYVVLYSWSPEHGPVGGFPEGAAPSLRVSKKLDGEMLVDALEQISASGTYRAPEDGRGDEASVDDAPSDPSRGRTTPRTWPGKAEGLTERESEIVFLIVEGCSNQELAERLFLGVNTVKTYIRSAYRRMGVSSRSKAVLWGIDHGFRQHRPPS